MHSDAGHGGHPVKRDDEIRNEFADCLRAYLEQRATVSDVLDFEAQYALDEELDDNLRGQLWRIALIGDEAFSGWRPISEFNNLARKTLSELAPPTVSTEVAAD